MSRLFLTVLLLFIIFHAKAQEFLNLTSGISQDYKAITDYQAGYLILFYRNKVDVADELINGREYVPYYFKCRIKPILFEESRHSGSLLFNGRKYYDQKLEYDTYLDELIYSDSSKLIDSKLFKIALNMDLVEGFNLYFDNDTLMFRPFRNPAAGTLNLPEGYYEVVYDGRSKYVIRHQSFLVEDDGIYEYRYTPSWYIMVGDRFSRFRSSRGFIKLFGEYSDRIRKYMRVNHIHARHAVKSEIADVLRYYDGLPLSGK